MPKYTFQCNSCKKQEVKNLKISEFMKKKTDGFKCKDCDKFLEHKISKIDTSIERSKEDIILDIQEDVAKTVEKIYSGDQRTIENVYGDTPNPYKVS